MQAVCVANADLFLVISLVCCVWLLMVDCDSKKIQFLNGFNCFCMGHGVCHHVVGCQPISSLETNMC